MAVLNGVRPMNRKFDLYSYANSASATSDAPVSRPDSRLLNNLTLQKTLFGNVVDIAPDEFFESRKTEQPRVIEIQCRYFAALDTKWLVYFQSKMFDIISAHEIGTQEYWLIKAKMYLGSFTVPDGGGLP